MGWLPAARSVVTYIAILTMTNAVAYSIAHLGEAIMTLLSLFMNGVSAAPMCSSLASAYVLDRVLSRFL